MRAEIAYQVIGGTKFYERAEIKDAIAYLTVLVNPQDVGAFTRIVNSPRRGIGSTSMSRVLAFANTMGESIWDAASDPEQVPGLGRGGDQGVHAVHGDDARPHASAPSRTRRSPSCCEEMLRETGYLEALEAERTIEAQGRIENLDELVNVAVEYDTSDTEEPKSLAGVPAADRARRRRRHAHRRRRPGDADDAPQRQGARVPDRVHHRLRGGRVPALARARRGRARGGAAALLRRDHARRARPLPDLRADPDRVRGTHLRGPEPVHRRDPGGTDRSRGAGPAGSAAGSARG